MHRTSFPAIVSSLLSRFLTVIRRIDTNSLILRQVRDVPSSAQRLHQKHTRVQPASQDINGISLVGKLDRLRGDDLQVCVDATLVTICKKLKRLLG